MSKKSQRETDHDRYDDDNFQSDNDSVCEEKIEFVSFTILETKFLASHLSFICKTSEKLNLIFNRNGIMGIQTMKDENSKKNSADRISSFVIPSSKIIRYEFNENFIVNPKTKDVQDFFILRFLPKDFLNIISGFKVNDILQFIYCKDDSYASIKNSSLGEGGDSIPLDVSIKYKGNTSIPISEDILNNFNNSSDFIRLESRLFTGRLKRIANENKKLMHKIDISFSYSSKTGKKGIRLSISGKSPKTFGDFKEKKIVKTLKINAKIIKNLTYYTKGNDKGFVGISENSGIIKIWQNTGTYMKTEYYFVAKK